MKRFITIREVNSNECGLTHSIQKGVILFQCLKPTYGCIDHRKELAVTLDPMNETPFFGIPFQAIKEI